jgi:hypothetical protein
LELKEIPRGARAGNCGTVVSWALRKERRRNCVSRVDLIVSLSYYSFFMLAFVSLVVVVIGVVFGSSVLLLKSEETGVKNTRRKEKKQENVLKECDHY